MPDVRWVIEKRSPPTSANHPRWEQFNAMSRAVRCVLILLSSFRVHALISSDEIAEEPSPFLFVPSILLISRIGPTTRFASGSPPTLEAVPGRDFTTAGRRRT